VNLLGVIRNTGMEKKEKETGMKKKLAEKYKKCENVRNV
jgi:hypothetical protein